MLVIQFPILMHNYPRARDVPHDDLFRLIGWDDLIKNESYANTCAPRVSLALIRSGVTIPDAPIELKIGPHKGKKIEPGQAKLATILSRHSMLGKPEKYSFPSMEDGIGNRSGIVSFFKFIPGISDNGHIDIVSPMLGGIRACGTNCYARSQVHHTNLDTFDHLRTEDLRQAAVILATVLLQAVSSRRDMHPQECPHGRR